MTFNVIASAAKQSVTDELANYRLDVSVTITRNVIARFDTAIHVLDD